MAWTDLENFIIKRMKLNNEPDIKEGFSAAY